MPCGTAQVKYAVRPCSFGWRWGWSQTWIFLYLVPVCICKQCFTRVRGGISGTRKRHDTTRHDRNSEPAKKRNEKEKKKEMALWKGGVRVHVIGIFGTGLLPPLIENSTFYQHFTLFLVFNRLGP